MKEVKEKKKLTPLHKHEVMDRTSIIMRDIDSKVRNHPFVEGNKHLEELSDNAVAAVYDLYNAIFQTKLK